MTQSSTIINTMLVLGSGNEAGNSIRSTCTMTSCVFRSLVPVPLTQFPVMQVACCELETRLAAATSQVCDNYYIGAVQQR